MGKTGIYTSLQPISEEGEEAGVAITDLDGFDQFIEDSDLEPITTWEYEDPDAYPRIEHIYLYGFQPPSRESQGRFKIHNLHVKRDLDEFREFWAEISEYTEPFTFHHSASDNHFPDLAHHFVKEHGEFAVYRVTCADGEIDIETFDFSDPTITDGIGE